MVTNDKKLKETVLKGNTDIDMVYLEWDMIKSELKLYIASFEEDEAQILIMEGIESIVFEGDHVDPTITATAKKLTIKASRMPMGVLRKGKEAIIG